MDEFRPAAKANLLTLREAGNAPDPSPAFSLDMTLRLCKSRLPTAQFILNKLTQPPESHRP